MDGRDLLRDVKAAGMVNRVVIRGGRAMEMERERIRVQRERDAFLLSSGKASKTFREGGREKEPQHSSFLFATTPSGL